ncbi:MAG: PEP-CTERM sorting domain-containing protein [Phycisphaeraceae bacterium]|nr:PEP-CTERM sorting domain-containing protein [Phycisphaeraceae bacterium]
MKISMFALALVAGTAVSAANAAVVLKHYGFDNGSLSPNVGSGDLNVVGTASNFAGTTLGLPGSGSPPGGPSSQSGAMSLAIVGTDGGSMTFSLSTINYTNIVFSFAAQRTGTGGANATVQYSLNGSTYNNLGIIVPGASSPGFGSSGIVVSDYFFSFTNAALANKANVFFRIVVPGATSASGNQRFDNLVVQGDLVPAPGSIALVGLAGLIAGRRRRN